MVDRPNHSRLSAPTPFEIAVDAISIASELPKAPQKGL